MNLNERKIKILEAIIKDHIETGEPIGSRTIAKKYDFGISSATIRNEMSDLEELGFILQPHTSSGRVPSDKGYRLYVDSIMSQRDLTGEEVDFLKGFIDKNINQIDILMQQTAKALSILTNYTTIVSKPKPKKEQIKQVQLMPLDETSIILILVTESKRVENYILKTPTLSSNIYLNKLNDILNEIVKTNSLDELDANLSSILNKYDLSDQEKQTVSSVFKIVLNTLKEQNDQIFTSGVKNILEFPEFSDINKAKNIFETFEEKEMLVNLFNESNSKKNSSVQILIGNENSIEPLKNCSVIKAEYKIEEATGTIAIIGPTRMDYCQTVSVLNAIIKSINKVIKALS